ncbi:MAG: 6-bladed beta-propeller [Cytophagia bacterium]|nr:6-bladed beta-propeller [Cytophagia bacterium]
MVFIDSELNVIKKASKITNPSQIPGASGRNLITVEDETYYHKHMSDSIFLIKDETVYPKFKLDFGDKWAWENPKNNESIQRAMKMFLNEEGFVVMVNPFMNKEYIFLSYYQGISNEQKGYIDRKSGRFYRFDMRKDNGENYDLNFLELEQNSLVSSLQSYDFEEFIENLDEDQWTVRGGFKLREILYSENPVLLNIKFK